MTTQLWESTLFGGWAVMRTKKPIVGGALRRLAIVSASSLQSKITEASCWLQIQNENGDIAIESRLLWPRREDPLYPKLWERAVINAHHFTLDHLTVQTGVSHVLTVKIALASTEENISGSTILTTWREVWDRVWYRLVIRTIQHFPSEELRLSPDDDRWSSSWQSFPFRVLMRTQSVTTLILHPYEEGTDVHLTIWCLLRQRIIKAHQRQGMPLDNLSRQARKFWYMLGLERHVSEAPSAVNPSSAQKTTEQKKALGESSVKTPQLSRDHAQQPSLWGDEE